MSQTRKEWNGLRVWVKAWEPRHPQDLVRSIPDRQVVDDARPEPEDSFLSDNEVTADSL